MEVQREKGKKEKKKVSVTVLLWAGKTKIRIFTTSCMAYMDNPDKLLNQKSIYLNLNKFAHTRFTKLLLSLQAKLL